MYFEDTLEFRQKTETKAKERTEEEFNRLSEQANLLYSALHSIATGEVPDRVKNPPNGVNPLGMGGP